VALPRLANTQLCQQKVHVHERREGSKWSCLYDFRDDVSSISFVENPVSDNINTLAQEQNIQD
jgi:hypothetical protein